MMLVSVKSSYARELADGVLLKSAQHYRESLALLDGVIGDHADRLRRAFTDELRLLEDEISRRGLRVPMISSSSLAGL